MQTAIVTQTISPHDLGASVPTHASRRLPSIDVLRGLVMVLMALDHTRDFFSAQAISLADPSHLTLSYFFTRWITHLCAPAFVFLSGLSAFLQAANGKSKAELSKFLIVRGCWLVVLQFTVIYFVLIGPPGIGIFQIIGAIGLCMIVLGGMVWLPLSVIAMTGLAIVAWSQCLRHRPCRTSRTLVGSLEDRARTGHHQIPGASIPVCCISVPPLERPYDARVQFRTSVDLAHPRAHTLDRLSGAVFYRRICSSSQPPWLRRSKHMDELWDHGSDDHYVPKRREVSAFFAIHRNYTWNPSAVAYLD